MNETNSLLEMYQQLRDEEKSVQELLNHNLVRIAEIEKFAQSIFDDEESDFKVFSPRNAEKMYKDEIDKNNTEKRKLEIENQSYYKRINRLQAYAKELDKVLKSDSQSSSQETSLMILDIQEKERQRIARDLHDTSLQTLAHLLHKIELSSLYMDKDPTRAKLELADIRQDLRATIEEIRDTIFDLRPMSFDDLGLRDALIPMFEKVRFAFPQVDLTYEIAEVTTHNEAVLMTMFRVIKECTLNAVRHSQGTKVFVQIENAAQGYRIQVKDNGVGFTQKDVAEKEGKHFGLIVVKERVGLLGGNITVESNEGEGTNILIVIPYQE